MLSDRTGEDPPTVVGGSQQRLLGRGYQGAVYLREGSTGTLIAKVPIGSGPARAARRAMLEREHRIYEGGRATGHAGAEEARGRGRGRQGRQADHGARRHRREEDRPRRLGEDGFRAQAGAALTARTACSGC